MLTKNGFNESFIGLSKICNVVNMTLVYAEVTNSRDAQYLMCEILIELLIFICLTEAFVKCDITRRHPHCV